MVTYVTNAQTANTVASGQKGKLLHDPWYLEVFSPKCTIFLVEMYIFTIYAYELFKVKMKNCK